MTALRKPLAFAAVLCCIVSFNNLQAATWTGAGSTPNWSDSGNWLGSTLPANNTTVRFDNNSALQLDTNNNLSLTGLKIEVANPAGSVSIAGNPLSLGASGIDMSIATLDLTISANVVLAANQTWNTGARTMLVSGAISGTFTLGKSGVGTLLLSGSDPNTNSGAITVTAGILALAKPTGVDAIAAALTINGATAVVRLEASSQIKDTVAVTISSGLLNLNNFDESLVSASTLTMGGIAAATTSITTGTGTLVLMGAFTYSSTNNPAGATISGKLDLGNAARTFTVNDSTHVNAAIDLAVSAVVSNGSLTKAGTGAMELSAANTFAGGVTLSAGTLIASVDTNPLTGTITDGPLGTGTITFNGGNLSGGSSARTLANNISFNNNGTINGSANLTLNGTFNLNNVDRTFTVSNTLTILNGSTSNGGGTRTLTKAGTGTLQLSGSDINAHTNTTVTGGTLLLAKTAGVDAMAGNLTVNAATAVAKLGASNQIKDTASVTVTSGTFNLDGFDETLGAATALTLGGTAATNASVLTGAGTLTLMGNIAYSSTNNSNGSTISGNLNLGGATRTINVGDSTNAARDLELSAVVSNGGITKTGAGQLWLSNTNTFTGGITISAGTLVADNSNSANTIEDSNHVTLTGGQLNVAGGPVSEVINELRVSSGFNTVSFLPSGANSAQLRAAAIVRTVPASLNVIRNPSGGAGTANLFANGILDGAALSFVTVTEGAAVNAPAKYSTTDGVILLNINATTAYRSNLANGSGPWNSPSTWLVNGLVPATAPGSNDDVVIVGADTVQLGGDRAASTLTFEGSGKIADAASTLTIGRGVLRITTTASSTPVIDSKLAFGGADLAIQNLVAATLTLNGNLSSITSVLQTGLGTLALNGASTHTGTSLSNGGTLLIGNDAALGVSANTLSFGAVATIQAVGANRVLADAVVIPGVLTVDGSFGLRFNGVISGAGSLVKSGSGELTLSGSNTFAGGTTLNAGTVTVGNANALSNAGTVIVNAGIAFQTLSPITIGRALTVNGSFAVSGSQTLQFDGAVGGTANFTVTTTNSVTATFTGTISGGARVITKMGTGTLILSGANTYSGGVLLNEGVLGLGNDAGFGTGALTISGGATVFASGGARSFTRAVNMNGDFTISGGNTLTFTGASGALTLGADRVITVSSPTGSAVFSGSIAGGSFGLTKSGPGALTLSAGNTYSGQTVVNGGTLRLNTLTGTIASTVVKIQNATLEIDNSSLASVPNRIPDTATVSFDAGNLVLKGATVTGQEIVGAVTFNSGLNTITLASAGSTGNADVLLTGVPTVNNGATLIFQRDSVSGGAASHLRIDTDAGTAGSQPPADETIFPYIAISTSVAPGIFLPAFYDATPSDEGVVVSTNNTPFVFTSRKSGNWDAPDTWNINGIQATVAPTLFDDVIIAGSDVVSLNGASRSIRTVSFNGSGKISGAPNVLTILNGTVTVSNSGDPEISCNVGTSVTQTAYTLDAGNTATLTISGSMGGGKLNLIKPNLGTVLLKGNNTFSAGLAPPNNSRIMINAGTLEVAAPSGGSALPDFGDIYLSVGGTFRVSADEEIRKFSDVGGLAGVGSFIQLRNSASLIINSPDVPSTADAGIGKMFLDADISGDGNLIKLGDNSDTDQSSNPGAPNNSGGNLILRGNNTYTGFTRIVGGSINLTGKLQPTYSNIPDLSTVDLIKTVGGTFQNDRGVLCINGNAEAFGGLSGDGFIGNQDSTNVGVLTIGGNNQNTIFSGVIGVICGGTGNGAISIIKVGTGSLTINANQLYTRGTSVNEGTVIMNGSIPTGAGATPTNPVTVAPNARFGGAGSVLDLGVSPGGTLAPGAIDVTNASLTGALTVRGNANLAGALLEIQLGSPTAGQFDQLLMTGTGMQLDITDTKLNVTQLQISTLNQSFRIIDIGPGTRIGTFILTPENTPLTEGAIFVRGGRRLQITYIGGDGNDVVLTDIGGDTVPAVVVAPTTLVTTEGGAPVTFSVNLTTTPDADVTVNFTPPPASEATLSSTALLFPANVAPVAQTVTLTPLEDNTLDGVKTFTLVSSVTSAATGYAGLNPADVNVTNFDNDPGFIVTPTAVFTTEGGTAQTFSVALNTVPSALVQVSLFNSNTREGTLNKTALLFPANTTALEPQIVTVTPVEDFVVDGAQVFTISTTVNSNDSFYGNAANKPSDITITNNDSGLTTALVTNVTSTVPDSPPAYLAGATIPITLKFDRPVTVTGTPQLTLETGVSDAVVNFSSQPASDTLLFNYIVASGHITPDLEYLSRAALALNGGTILDTATNIPAILTLPKLNAPGSLGFNKNIVIDGKGPAVLGVSATTPNGTYTTGALITLTVTFDEAAVVSGGTPQLLLETGTNDAVVDYVSGSGTTVLTFNYTVAAGHDTANAVGGKLNYKDTASLLLPQGVTIKDASGNNADLSLPPPVVSGVPGSNSLGGNTNILISTVTPAVVNVTSSHADGSFKTGEVIDIQVVLNKNVDVNLAGGSPTLKLQTKVGGTDAVYLSGTGTNILVFRYTVQSSDASADLDYVSTPLALNGATIISSVGALAFDLNSFPAPGSGLPGSGSLSVNKNIVIDSAAPFLNAITTDAITGVYGIGASLVVSLEFNEGVILAGGTLSVTLNNGKVLTIPAASLSSTLSATYVVAQGETATALNVSAIALSLGATLRDAATNDASLTLPVANFAGKTVKIDGVRPTVLSIARTSTSPTNAAQLTFLVTFSEDVSGVDFADFVIDPSVGVTNAAILNVTKNSPSVYTVQVNSGSGDGTLGLNTNSSISVQDAGGNALTAAFTTGEKYTLDKTVPQPTIARFSSNPTAAASVAFTVTFNKPVTGVDALDFALAPSQFVTGATISSIDVMSSSVYKINVTTGSGDGTLGLNFIDNDSVTDAVGNTPGGTGTGNGNVTGPEYMLVRAPSVLSITAASSNPTKAASVNFLVTFDKAVSGVATGSFTLAATGSVTAASVTSVTPVSGSSYSVAVNTGSGSGTLKLQLIDDDTIVNVANVPLGGVGLNNGDFLNGVVYTIDKTPPVVTVNPLTTNDSTPRLSGTVSETGTTIQVTVNALTYSATNNGDGTWTLADNIITTPLADGTYDVAASATDAVGNSGSDSSSNELVIISAPTIASVQPSSGVSLGGETVVITGTNFEAGTQVFLDGVKLTTVTVQNATTLSFVTPVHIPGTITLVVRNPDNKQSTAANGFTYIASPSPQISAVAPANGPPAGGTAVTLTGSNFATGATVLFDAQPATQVVVVSATQITAVTPAHTSGAVNVRVTNPDSQVGTLSGGFAYDAPPAPQIALVTPKNGPAAGGTSVTLTGANFVSGATVLFDTSPATQVVVVSATQIMATTPSHAPGAVNIRITNPDSQSGTLNAGYTYDPLPAPVISGISPTHGPSGGGTLVTLTGSNFVSGATVLFDTSPATQVIALSATQITALTPAHVSAAVTIRVTNPDAQFGTLSAAYTYDAPPKPILTAVTPSQGPTQGGTTVTLTGGNFATGATVLFDTSPATQVTVLSATQISAIAPAHAAGLVSITVTNPSAQSVLLSDAFTYVAPVTFASAPTFAPVNPKTGETVTVSAAASSTLPTTLTFNFGDGSADSSSATHIYSTPGTYTLTVTAKDALSSVAQTLEITVSQATVIVPAKAMSFSKLQGGIKFDATGKDTISFTATLPDLPAGYDFKNATMLLDIGGAQSTFALSDKGAAKNAEGSVKLTLKFVTDKITKEKKFVGGPVKFSGKFKGTFATPWKDHGITALPEGTKSITLPAGVTLNGVIYTDTTTPTYSVKKGTGKFTFKR